MTKFKAWITNQWVTFAYFAAALLQKLMTQYKYQTVLALSCIVSFVLGIIVTVILS